MRLATEHHDGQKESRKNHTFRVQHLRIRRKWIVLTTGGFIKWSSVRASLPPAPHLIFEKGTHISGPGTTLSYAQNVMRSANCVLSPRRYLFMRMMAW
jgi:hypothetical protein